MTNPNPPGRPRLYGQPTRDLRVTCPDDLYDEVTEESRRTKTSRSRLVVEALREWLRRTKQA